MICLRKKTDFDQNKVENNLLHIQTAIFTLFVPRFYSNNWFTLPKKTRIVVVFNYLAIVIVIPINL